ncbi:MAG: lamin tail domain-containing protein, partial [bacterium]
MGIFKIFIGHPLSTFAGRINMRTSSLNGSRYIFALLLSSLFLTAPTQVLAQKVKQQWVPAQSVSKYDHPADHTLSKGNQKILTVSPNVVISQVYGGAGCGTAGCSTYQNDFIELFNRGTTAVSLNGWSVQYSSATGTAWQVTPLTNFTLQPGQYYLVAESFGANGVSPLPTPDVTGTIAMSATAAKVAVVNVTTALSGACPTGAQIVDFVGYGATANCFEGAAPAPAPSTTTADIRAGNGRIDTDQNSTDFTAATPTPRNSSSAGVAVTLLISEFRLRGPNGATDEFVEIYNPSNVATTVSTTDGSAGYALVASDLTVRFTIP